MSITWSFKQDRIWATRAGRCIPTWEAQPDIGCGLVAALNGTPALGALLLFHWQGEGAHAPDGTKPGHTHVACLGVARPSAGLSAA